jgi:uncharacterized membrane protein
MPYENITRPRAVSLAALIFCIVVIADSWFRWWSYQYTTFDLAFYTQGLWMAGHGKGSVSLLDVPLMGNHQEPIVFLLLPLFKIWSSPMLLVIVQALMFATMPFTGWRIARHLEFGPRASMWLAIATLLAPAAGFVALHEFHPEALAAPLILLLLEARMKEILGLFWMWFLLVLMCKENMALLLAWMCAVHYVLEGRRGREWRIAWNVIPGCFALGWLLLCTVVVGPWLNGGKVDYLELYSHLGNSGTSIVTGFFTEPSRAGRALWRGLTEGNLVFGLVVPFLLLPLLRPRWLFVAAPVLAQHLLSWRPSEWNIQYHYAAPLLPLFWFGAVEAGAKLFWRDTLAAWLAIACAICQVWFGPARRVWNTVAGARDAVRTHAWKKEMLASIPADASVTAGIPYLSHLAKRERLYSLHHILKGLVTLSRKTYTPPAPTDVVIVDAADAATFDRKAGNFHPRMKTVTGQIIPASDILLHEYLRGAQWQKSSRNELTIFLRGASPPVEAAAGAGRKLDEHHTLLSIQRLPPDAGDSLKLRLDWQVQKERTAMLWVALYLRDETGRLFSIIKGPIAPEVESGPASGEWAIRPPPSARPGKYQALILVYDPFDTDRPPDNQVFKRVTFDVGEIGLK